MKNFKLLMISAMYENGGNTVHRFFDGHPQMFVYPFESQLGTRLVNDNLSSLFPIKYRWPEFRLDGTAKEDYHAIIDEEGKIRSKTPHVSKFRHVNFDMTDARREKQFIKWSKELGRSRAHNVEAFFRSTFEAWLDYKTTGKEKIYVGYSPVLIPDAPKIIADFPDAHILHIVRNPWSAYADTKKRPMPLSLAQYIFSWNLNQYWALYYKKRYPKNVHIIRTEDVMANSYKTLSTFCEQIGLKGDDSLKQPSWNGQALTEVYPWGTLRKVTPEVNKQTAMELSRSEQAEIKQTTWQYLSEFNYQSFI